VTDAQVPALLSAGATVGSQTAAPQARTSRPPQAYVKQEWKCLMSLIN